MNLAFDVTERLDERERVDELLARGHVVRPYTAEQLAEIERLEAQVRDGSRQLADRLFAGRANANDGGAADDA